MTNPGRRERKRQYVRDQLYRSAIELFVAQGYETTTVDQIAERADVARATVFNYFSQKDGFLEEWGARRRARVIEELQHEHADERPVGERLRGYLQGLADINLASRSETKVLIAASMRFGRLMDDPTPEGELTRIVEEGKTRGEVRADVDPAEVGSIVAASYFTNVLRWSSQEPAPFDLKERLDRMLTVILTGISVGE